MLRLPAGLPELFVFSPSDIEKILGGEVLPESYKILSTGIATVTNTVTGETASLVLNKNEVNGDS
jgi:hypothetical protein